MALTDIKVRIAKPTDKQDKLIEQWYASSRPSEWLKILAFTVPLWRVSKRCSHLEFILMGFIRDNPRAQMFEDDLFTIRYFQKESGHIAFQRLDLVEKMISWRSTIRGVASKMKYDVFISRGGNWKSVIQ